MVLEQDNGEVTAMVMVKNVRALVEVTAVAIMAALEVWGRAESHQVLILHQEPC